MQGVVMSKAYAVGANFHGMQCPVASCPCWPQPMPWPLCPTS